MDLLFNDNGDRLIQCVYCNQFKTIDSFWCYGGRYTENLGKCIDCEKRLNDLRNERRKLLNGR